MSQLKGASYVAQKLEAKRPRALVRYSYYEMKHKHQYRSELIPERYRWMMGCLGWCAKSVDSLANRLSFNEFRNDNYLFNDLYNDNNPDVIFDAAILGALITSCSFIYLHEGVKMEVIDGTDATGIMDLRTGMLIEGFAVLERDVNGKPTRSAYFETGKTTYFENGNISEVKNPAPYPLLVPIVYRPDARRPFGHSRISRASMAIVDQAVEEMLRTRVSSEFYSFPQKYVLGMSNEDEFNGTFATYANFLRLDADENGNRPSVGQFQSGSMTPHIEYMKMLAAQFAGETGLTLDDLGFIQANPSTAEAIKASYENLRLTATRAQKTFGRGFINAGYLGACLKNGIALDRSQIAKVKCAWEPLFIPDASALAGIGDGIIKLEQAKPNYITDEKMYDLVGF